MIKEMFQWRVNELSGLTKVTVRTLHHYDRIGLLKPSVRQPNRYRLYSEADLLKLQQILALKSFGFDLTRIKLLVEGQMDLLDHFRAQQQFIDEKISSLQETSRTLKSIISDCDTNKSIPWETILNLIEIYDMTQQLKKTWAGKVLTPEQLKEYASFEAGLKSRFTAGEKKTFEKNWSDLIAHIGANLEKDPRSDFGLAVAKRCMDMINGLYGKEYANLKHSIWHEGFKKGQMDEEHALSPEIVSWLDQAIDGYYRGRIYSLLDQLESSTSHPVLPLWNDLMTEMFGDSAALKQDLVEVALTDDKVRATAKVWLRQNFKS